MSNASNDSNGKLNGQNPPATDGEEREDGSERDLEAEPEAESPPAATPTPDHVAELAASCARFVHAKYGVPLDGTSDTLSLLDQYVREARTDVNDANLELLSATIGAYLGEVVRRAYGGIWFAEGDYGGWRVDMTRVFLTFNPLGMAREALTLQPAEGWHAHLEMDPAESDEVERRLAALPPVDDEEYYLPTTRFDVVALAVEALRAKMVENGTADVTFTPDDYRRT